MTEGRSVHAEDPSIAITAIPIEVSFSEYDVYLDTPIVTSGIATVEAGPLTQKKREGNVAIANMI